jgi:hypothetical protein
MTDQQPEPTVAEALDRWRRAERTTIRATAQREAADDAVEAARLADEAARATAAAADAAMTAATEAARAARATADAAHRFLVRTEADSETAHVAEATAIEEETAAREAHHEARDRAAERLGRA